MRVTVNIQNPLSVRMLALLVGGILGLVTLDSRLPAQEPPRALNPEWELKPLRAPKPKVEEPDQGFEAVAPDSAAIPKSWFKDVPVAPVGVLLQPEDVPACLRILDHVRGIPQKNLVEADREFRLEMIEKFGDRKRKEFQNEFKDETQRERILKELEKRMDDYRKDPFSYELVRDAFNQSNECQGKVTSFSGRVRRAHAIPAGENEYGFDQLYEVWLFDNESNGYPVIIVCTELPTDFPVDFPETDTVDGVSVRGYFFKLYAYEGGEKYHAIPMILAKSVQWNPPETVSRTIPQWAYALVIVLGIVALWLIIRSNRSTRPVRTAPPPEDNPFQ